MQTIFQCPDCNGLHAEPLDATYTIAVRCANCSMHAEWLAERSLSLPQAA